MDKFIKANDIAINVKDIREIEFLGDDIYLGLIPKTKEGIYLVDYIPFEYARITTFNDRTLLLSIDLYVPEEQEDEDSWCEKNRAYINIAIQKLYEVLEPITIDGTEYMS